MFSFIHVVYLYYSLKFCVISTLTVYMIDFKRQFLFYYLWCTGASVAVYCIVPIELLRFCCSIDFLRKSHSNLLFIFLIKHCFITQILFLHLVKSLQQCVCSGTYHSKLPKLTIILVGTLSILFLLQRLIFGILCMNELAIIIFINIDSNGDIYGCILLYNYLNITRWIAVIFGW